MSFQYPNQQCFPLPSYPPELPYNNGYNNYNYNYNYNPNPGSGLVSPEISSPGTKNLVLQDINHTFSEWFDGIDFEMSIPKLTKNPGNARNTFLSYQISYGSRDMLGALKRK